MPKRNEIHINVFYPTAPHKGQQEVLDALDNGERFVLLRAGRKWRKTSLIISWLFENAFKTGLVCPYIAPNRVLAKDIAWDDHVRRMLDHFYRQGLEYKKHEVELSVTLPNGGKVKLLGVEAADSQRGKSNWAAIGCDEYDDWKEDVWPYIIRPNLIPHRAPAIVAGTPDGFRNMYRMENSEKENGEKIFKTFHFTSYDNPEIDPGELDDLAHEYKLEGMGAYRQEILAQYEKPRGTVYKEWDMDRRYIDFDYDSNLPLHLSWDFGINDSTSVLFIQPNGSELRLVDYYEASDANLEHFTQIISSKPYKTPANAICVWQRYVRAIESSGKLIQKSGSSMPKAKPRLW